MFDRFVESERRPALGRARRMVIAGSVLLHGVAAGALVARSFLHVEMMSMKEPPLIYAGPIVSLPDPPRGGDTRPNPDKRTRKTPPGTLIQPRTSMKPDPAPRPDPGPSADPVDGVQSDGSGTPGVPGTAPCSPGGCTDTGGSGTTPVVPAAPPAIRKTPPPEPDQWLERAPPALPDDVKLRLRGAGETWSAILCADTDGRIFKIKELHGIAGAEEAIPAGVKQWRLKPQSVPICFPVAINYTVE